MLRPYFWNLLVNNRILAAVATVRADGAHSLRIIPKPGLSADRSDATVYELTRWRRQTMQKGTVKWFNPTKGYGFIRPSAGDKDVFVHISAVERAGLSTLNEGQNVEYELVTNRGKTSAENLRVS
jgi:CspA family cold shock protein